VRRRLVNASECMRHTSWKKTACLVACFVVHGSLAVERVERRPLMRRADQRARQPEPNALQSGSASKDVSKAPLGNRSDIDGVIEKVRRSKGEREASLAKLARLAQRKAEAELKLARAREELQAIAEEERTVIDSLAEQFNEIHDVLSAYQADQPEAIVKPPGIVEMQSAQAELPSVSSLVQMKSQQAAKLHNVTSIEQSHERASTTTHALPTPAATTTRAPASNKSRFISFYKFALILIVGVVVILGVAWSIRFYRSRTLSGRLVDSTYWRSAKARQRNRLYARSPTATMIRIDSRDVGPSSDGVP